MADNNLQQDNKERTLDELFQQATQLEAAGKYPEAMEILQQLITVTADFVHEDDEAEYICFRSSFERLLYFWNYHPAKHGVNASLPISSYYYHMGRCLISLKRPAEAREYLAKALLWNPVDFDIHMEYACSYQMEDDLQDFLYVVRRAARYAYTGRDHARVLRSYGYYCIEQENYEAAEVCHLMSRIWDPDDGLANKELVYISQKSGNAIGHLSDERIGKVQDQLGFTLYPNKTVINLARDFGKSFYDDQNWPAARDCLGILYDLTDDKDAAEMLAQIPEGGADDE